MKKILVVDDSALMRRIFCDILASDGRFEVTGMAKDGQEALDLLKDNKYDAIILDINMPKMNGIEFLEALQKLNKKEKVIVASTDTADGADVTIKALELGALDFIQKPKNTLDAKQGYFREHFLELVGLVTEVKNSKISGGAATPNRTDIKIAAKKSDGRKKLVAIACSTGGPNALQHVVPRLPKDLDAPVLIVQHMPAGFTAPLADRLNSLGAISVKEAAEHDVIEKGHVYIAKGGAHMKYEHHKNFGMLYFSDEPPREGVKPCANYMYESLIDSDFDEIVCVVMTGMGSDGTVGIKALAQKKKVTIIAQDEKSCTVYGMPKAIVNTGLVKTVTDLDSLANEITSEIGIR